MRSSMIYRCRSPLARNLLVQLERTLHGSRFDSSVWYTCKMSRMDDDLKETFLQCHLDEAASQFLECSSQTSNSFCLQIFYKLAMAFLCFFMSLTDMNGLLGRGATFVFSSNQLQKLMDKAGITQSQYTNMLDIGAGDGSVTDQMKAMFASRVSVTEMSPTMRRSLRRKGYGVFDVEHWQTKAPFDWISMLNVLDRCDKPKTLLQDIYDSLTPNGVFLLSVVLPFDPIVLKGPRKVAPNEKLQIEGGTFESSLNSLVNDILKPQGFRVLSWTRVPYFSEGDFLEPYYVLDNALLLLQRHQDE